jgi:P27 family predicted phage terminase small subunit
MRGRKPTPTALKVRMGNPGGRPLNRQEPKPAISAPTCPAHLLPTAKAEWKRLAPQLENLGILSQLDRAALAGYCQAYGRWVEAEKRLKETPILLKTPAGYVQPSPWLGIANKQLELMHRFMGELGLSPASRSRVAAFPSLTPKPWDLDDDFAAAAAPASPAVSTASRPSRTLLS